MFTIDIYIKILLGIILFLSSIFDIKTRRIPIKTVIAGMVIIIISTPFRKELSILNSILGVVVGLAMMGISKVTREQVGLGDGIILMLTGISLGLWSNITLLLYALFCISIFSIALLITKRITRKMSLPFVPFLFIGYLGVIFL